VLASRRGWKKFRILVSWIPTGKFWGVGKFFGGKKRVEKKGKKRKEGRKMRFFTISPQNSQCKKVSQKFPNAKNFPTNFPMLKISQLISQS